MITKNVVVKTQNLVVTHESQPVKSKPKKVYNLKAKVYYYVLPEVYYYVFMDHP